MRLVQRVEMDSRRSGAQQILALLCGVFDAEFRRRRVVITQLLQPRRQWGGQAGPAKHREPLDLSGAQNRNNAGHKRHFHAKSMSHVIPEFKKIGVVEEKLRQHEVRAGINLRFQVLPIHMFPLFAGDVSLRESRNPDAEAVKLPDEPDQFAGKLKSTRRHFELTTARWIAAQREDISDSQSANLLQQFADLLFGGRHARQMRDRREAVLFLNAVHDPQRLVPRTATGAVGHRAVIGFGCQQGGDGFFDKIAVALVRFWGGKLERNHRLAGGLLRSVDVSNRLHEKRTMPENRPNPSFPIWILDSEKC